MSITKKILFLTLFQGILCQRWEFPAQIVGLVGDCVEIPCMFYSDLNPKTTDHFLYLYLQKYELFNMAWLLHNQRRNVMIFNSEGSYSVLMHYRDRTSLVPGNNSCSLRIDPVRREDGEENYYPGLSEDLKTNAWSQYRMTLQLHVTDIPSIPEITGNGELVEGRPEVVSCSVEHTCRSSPPSLKWNKPGQTERRTVDLSGGNWREILTIRYIPSHEDHKTEIQCTATYHNGRTSQNAATLNVRYAATKVQVVEHRPTEGATELRCSFVSSSPNVTHYTWMKDGNILINKTEQILVLDSNEENSGSYSCIAHNTAGSSASAELDFKDSNVDKDSTGITYSYHLFLILGIMAGVVLLIVIVCFYIRTKARQPSARQENLQQPDATYTDLMKTEVLSDYDTLKSSFPAQSADGARDLPSENHYENLQRK